MRMLMLPAVVVACALLVAQTAAADTYNIGLMGSGSLMMNGATYTGSFMFGMTGTWTMSLDDSLWPDESDSTARWNYIWDNYFADNYDDTPGAQAWFGYFDGLTLPTTPRFEFVTTAPGGVVAGDCSWVIMIRDWNGDGLLSQSEKHRDSQLTITMQINPDLGTGAFENICGWGSMSSGNFKFVNPPQLNYIQIVGMLQTEACPNPVEDRSWGTIKALYQ